MEVNLHKEYQRLWQSSKRYILVTGGRGSGKSFGVAVYVATKSYEDYFKALFTRFVMKTAHDSVIPELTSKIEVLNLQEDFHVTKTDVINKVTGNEILFRGIKTSSGDQTANLKSLEGVNLFVVDEAEEFLDEEKFNTIDLSIRTTKAENKVIIIMNPSHKNHWVYKRWFTNNMRHEIIDGQNVEICTHPDVDHIHTTYLDNINHLDETFIQIAENYKTNNPTYYAHKFLGAWQNQSDGATITSVKLFRKEEVQDAEICLGYIDVADEGSDLLVAVFGKKKNGLIYVTDVICSDKNSDITTPMVTGLMEVIQPSYVRVESNSMGAMYGKELRKHYRPSAILMLTNTVHKHTRIISESSFIMTFFRFLVPEQRDGDYNLFMDYVLRYDKDESMNKKMNIKDDPNDALSGLSQFFRGMFRSEFL